MVSFSRRPTCADTPATAPVARSCRVGRVDNDVLTLYADNGSIASKLNQQLPSLLEKLQQRGVKITRIQVRVQVKIPLAETVVAPKVGISAGGMASLEKLGTELPDSPLKEALTNLIKHHNRSN